MTLDTRAWDEDMLTMMCAVGNTRANCVWESDMREQKPTVETPRPEREQWIRAKYERRAFLSPPAIQEGGGGSSSSGGCRFGGSSSSSSSNNPKKHLAAMPGTPPK